MARRLRSYVATAREVARCILPTGNSRLARRVRGSVVSGPSRAFFLRGTRCAIPRTRRLVTNMEPDHKLNESPKQRLERVAAQSAPFRWELRSPTSFTVIGLALLIATLLIVGVVGGYLGSHVVGDYAQRIWQWAWPTGR